MTERPTDSMTAEEFDAYVDDGGDVSALFEGAELEHPGRKASPTRVVITPPDQVIAGLDAEAERRGVSRRAVINTALYEWLREERRRDPAA